MKKNKIYYLLFLISIVFHGISSCDSKNTNDTDEIIVLEWHDNLESNPKKIFIPDNNAHNKRNGIYKTYRADGTLISEIQLKDGKKNGEAKHYYSNGQLFYITNFKNDNMHGSIVTYSKDGNILSKGKYVNGKKNGDWYFYDKDGNIKEIKSF